MVKNLKKFLIAGAALLMGATALAGCSSAITDASNQLGEDAVNALNKSAVVAQVTDEEFTDFTFLGAEFDRANDYAFNVDVSGIAKYKEGANKAYVTMNYLLDDSYFDGVDVSKKEQVINAISKAMQTEEMKDFDFLPIANVKALNGTLKKISESPLDDFHYGKGMVFALGNLKLDEENGSVSFQMKSHVNYSKTESRMEPGMVWNGESYTLGMVMKTYHYNEDFIHTNDVYVKVSQEDMDLIKLDPSYAVDAFISRVKKKKKDSYVVNSVEVDKVSDLDTSMLNEVDKEKL